MSAFRDELDKLFSSSLTEFTLIIAFMFVLVSVSFKVQRDEAIEMASISIIDLSERIRFKEKLTKLEKKFGIEHGAEVLLADRISAIYDALPENMSKDEDWDSLIRIKEIIGSGEEVSNELMNMSNKINHLTKINKHLISRSGLDKQPCEISEKGKVQYLASVKLHDEFTIFSKLSDHKLNFIQPDVIQMQYEDFEALSKIYYEWSDREENDCRFYVKVYDYSTTKDSYKSSLSIVERYFYKYESRS